MALSEVVDPAPPLPLDAPPHDSGAHATCPGPSAAEATVNEPIGKQPLPASTCPEPAGRERIEPLSGKSYLIQFTADAELVENIEAARELLLRTPGCIPADVVRLMP